MGDKKMIRGTRSLVGEQARKFNQITRAMSDYLESIGFDPFIPSCFCNKELFLNRAGNEIAKQIYSLNERPEICLIPEVTAVIQKEYKSWKLKEPAKIYYLSRCFRNESPQIGRYREFWQMGVEVIGTPGYDTVSMIKILMECLHISGLKNYKLNNIVKRGLEYYVDDGFEVDCEFLGSQRQIAGGGKYDCGTGWAIGIDRLLLAIERDANEGKAK